MSGIFRHLLVLGRPACGKSEFIDFLKHTEPGARRERFHIGRFATLLIEFSRGGAKGFGRALGRLDAPILAPAAIFYIKVSREESWRRNVARYQEKLKHSILAHMVPRETYDYFYDSNDWDELTGGRPSGWLDVSGVRVPFVSMNNEPESTDPQVLEPRYGAALDELWSLRCSRP
jgi:hypothetical protein